jgi:transposase
MSKIVLGVDVSKDTLSLCLLKKEDFRSKTVENSESGFKAIEKFIIFCKNLEIYMEATGIYHSFLADYFVDRGYIVKVVNPRKIHAFSEAKLSRNKTDKADAKLIAEYGMKFEERAYQKPRENIRKIKELYRTYLGLSKQVKMCKNHIKTSKDPEVEEYWKETLSDLNKLIKKLTDRIVSIITEDTDLASKFKNLQTIPGIAKITAIAVLSEVGNVEDFLSARQLAAYIGVTPKHKQSGTSVQGKARISKIGNSILRKALFMPAMSASKASESIHKYKEKQKAKGKAAKKIIIAIMKKIVHAIFAILKNGSTFNEKLLFKNA